MTCSVHIGDQSCDVALDAAAGTLLSAVVDAVVPTHLRWETIAVDGRAVPVDIALERAGVRDGSVIAVGPVADVPPTPAGSLVGRRSRGTRTLRVVGGIDAGAAVALRGPLVVGRGPGADVRVDDPTVRPRHVRIVPVGPTGARAHELPSRRGAAVDPDDRSPVDLSPGTGRRHRIGSTMLTVHVDGDDRWRGGRSDRPRVLFNRPPRGPVPPPGTAIPVPEPPVEPRRAAGIDVVTIVVPVAIGVAMVAMLGNLRYGLFAVVGPAMMVLGRISQRRTARKEHRLGRRRFRRSLRDLDDALAADGRRERARLDEMAPDPAEVVDRVVRGSRRLWERRPGDAGHLLVHLGRGRHPYSPPVDADRIAAHPDLAATVAAHATIDDCAIALDLDVHPVLGLVGDSVAVRALARSILVQTAVHQGPADVSIEVHTGGTGHRWRWTRWLPHHRPPGGSGASADDASSTLLIVDHRDLGDDRLLAARVADPDTRAVVLASSADRLPASCTVIVTVEASGSADMVSPASGSVVAAFVVAGLGEPIAQRVARGLAPHRDPLLGAGASGLPTQCAFEDCVPERLGVGAIVRSWATPEGGLPVVIGIGEGDTGPAFVEVDPVLDGPHMLVGGTTGSGKSELLRALVCGLALRHGPEQIVFVLVDYKGGSSFDDCADLPHVVGLVTDLDEQLGARALRSLEAEIQLRERWLRDARARDLDGYRAAGEPAGSMPRLMVVIDEFAAMADELPDLLGALVDIAQRGRSLGIHLVLATQRPSGAVGADIRANTNLRIGLRMQDAADSVDVLDCRDAADLPADVPGRCLVKVGSSTPVAVQTAVARFDPSEGRHDGVVVERLAEDTSMGHGPAIGPTVPAMGTTAALVALIGRAAVDAAVRPPRRPWLPPLPEVVGLAEVLAAHAPDDRGVPFAMADDPDRQRRAVVSWEPRVGHLCVFGAGSSGADAALVSLVVSWAARTDPASSGVHLIDFGAGALTTLRDLPHVASVIGAGDEERCARLVRVLTAELELRRLANRSDPPIVVAVDRLPLLLRTLNEVDGPGEEAAKLRRLLDEGAVAGIHVACTVDRPGALSGSLSAAFGARVVLALADPGEVTAFGLRPRDVPRPRRGRGIDVTTGLEVQVGAVDPTTMSAAAGWATTTPIARIETMPARVPLTPMLARSGTGMLTVGIGGDTLGPVMLPLRPGAHLLVAGGPRSGVTTALRTAIRGSRCAGRDVAVAVLTPPGSAPIGGDVPVQFSGSDPSVFVRAVDDARGTCRWLVVVDDAHRFDDAAVWAMVCARSDVQVVAGARTDRLLGSPRHWTTAVRACGSGLLLGGRSDRDGDLLHVRLPRRPPTPPAPGRGWVVSDGSAVWTQIAA